MYCLLMRVNVYYQVHLRTLRFCFLITTLRLCVFWLNNNFIIQQAKQWLLAFQASAITTGRLYILKQNALQNLIAYFAATWAAVLQPFLTQLKLHFKKNLRRSIILLIIVAMDQSGCNSIVVRGSK